jgi:hypothetical protein
MSERDLETRLRSAYRSTAERTDPGALSERVHSIPATVEPERRRWWHRFRSGATRHAGLGGAQVRGASNMLSATRVAAVVAALALGTTYLAVQVGDPPETAQQLGAQATDGWAIVTGTQTLIGASPDCALAGKNRNMSDPRLEGDVCIEYEEDEGGEDLATYWSSITITNDDGSWQGHSVGFMDEQGAHRHTGWFEGHGAYEDLAFIQQLTEANPEFPSAGGNLDMVGLIYEGELPPMIIPDWAADTAGDAG